MRSVLRVVVVAAAIATAGLLNAAIPVSAAEVVVHPGQRIQSAIDAAASGSTVRVAPGTYRENLLITKPLTLRGSGEKETVLTLPSTPTATPCSQGSPGVVGICVAGKVTTSAPPQVLERVANVTITGFLMTGFTESGIMGVATERLRVTRVRSDNNGGYGVFSLAAKHTLMSENQASENAEAGFYLGESPESDSLIEENVATNNGLGVFMRDSTRVTASRNKVSGNCMGILALNTTPNGAGEYTIEENQARENDKFCPPFEGRPSFSGIGIALVGVHGVRVKDNVVTKNAPAQGQTVIVPPGGVIVITFGGVAPTNNTVQENKILDNQPFDIFWDKTGSNNRFQENDCRTSSPPGLCGGERGEGTG